MKTDRAYRPNSDQVFIVQSRKTQAKYDRIVEIIRANPGISGGAVAKAYYPATASWGIDRRMHGMLLSICCSGRIKCVDNCCFIVEV